MFESVLTTNFDAVALLRYGRFDESLFLLRVALSAVQEEGAVPPLEACTGEGAQAMVSSIPLEDCEGGCASSKAKSGDDQSSCFDIFTRGFIFEGPRSLANSDRNACLCASVCLYNMALGMHLKGLKEGGLGYLRKASGLYEKVFSILSGFAPEPTDSASSLLLATVLNLIACEGELRGHTSTNSWKIVYSNLYAWATQTAERPAAVHQPEELEFFATSAVLFSNQNFTSAAAA